jgi:hypothetical protein
LSRKYIVFGAGPDGEWRNLSTVEARDPSTALDTALTMTNGEYGAYACCPERNWTEGEAQITPRPPLVTWKDTSPHTKAKDKEEKKSPPAPVAEPEKEDDELVDRATDLLERTRGAQ